MYIKIQNFGDTCTVSIDKKSKDIKFSTVGDTTNYCATLKNSSNVRIVVKKEFEPVSFALRYLSNFIKATALDDFVIIDVSPNLPMKVTYCFGNDQKSFVCFYLAPKIEE